MELINEILQRAPEVALFLTIGFGYLLGKIRFGMFTLGTTAGSLIVGIGIGIGFPDVTLDPLTKVVFFDQEADGRGIDIADRSGVGGLEGLERRDFHRSHPKGDRGSLSWPPAPQT